MKNSIARRGAAVLALLVSMTGVANAQSTQTLNINVAKIVQFAFNASAVTLTISTATAGSDPAPATGASTWALTNNTTNALLSASLDTPMPAGMTLSVLLGVPAGSTSSTVNLTAVSQQVADLTKSAQSGLAVTYTLTAPASSGYLVGTRTVTYTVVAGS
jgi:hypothetical protein